VLVWSNAWKAKGEKGDFNYSSKHTLETEAVPVSPKSARLSNSTKDQKDDDDQEDKAYSTARKISPIPAVRPSRQHSQQRHYQNHN
jgi:hypothetical protein